MSYDVRTARQLGRLSPVQLQELLVAKTGFAAAGPRRGNPIHCRTTPVAGTCRVPGDAAICRVMPVAGNSPGNGHPCRVEPVSG